MATTWQDIVTDSAMVIIDDVRLADELTASPARFFRKMSLYVKEALPMMCRPPELLTRLKSGMTEPQFTSLEWVSTEESTGQEVSVPTDFPNAEIVSIVRRITGNNGIVTETVYTDAAYDAETGVVTFPVQQSVGEEYEIDLYIDGDFSFDLSATQMRLFGMAVAIVWDERQERNWLNIQPKIQDSSFKTVNEANYIRAAQERLRMNRAAFNDEARKYEQDVAYHSTVSSAYQSHQIKNLI